MLQLEIKLGERNLTHAEKKYRQDKENELKHNEFRSLGQIKCELVTRTKALSRATRSELTVESFFLQSYGKSKQHNISETIHFFRYS